MAKMAKVKNEGFSRSWNLFGEWCEKTGTAPTTRQWNKWKRKLGKVWTECRRQAGHDKVLRRRMEDIGCL